jgi:nitroreductase
VNFLELAKRRYSVRSFQNKPVEKDDLLKVLEAASLAPSACNNQPLIVIVIQDLSARKKLDAAYNRGWFLSAPVIIAACCDNDKSWKRSDGRDYGEVDVAIAVDHMTLAAAELGLGTCWIGAFKDAEARKILNLPDHIDLIAFTPLGYPASERPVKARKKIDEFVYWESFGNTQISSD